MPKVSICTPVLNMQSWLDGMIATVLAQTFQDWELIVVDDGSTDKVVVPDDPRIKLHVLPHQGVTKAINAAFAMARGVYVQPLSADEFITPTKLAEQVAFLDAHPDIQAVFGLPGCVQDSVPWDAEVHGPSQYDRHAYNRSKLDWIATLLRVENVPISSASALWRRELFAEIGYFDEQFIITSDLEWYVRLFSKHDIHIMARIFGGSHPRSDGNALSAVTTANMVKFREEMVRVRAKHVQAPVQSGHKGKVVIATPFYEIKGFSPYIKSLLTTVVMLERHGFAWDYWPLDGDSYVDRARNTIIERFLEDPEATDLFFIDSDESWDELGFLRVLMAPVDVCGAAYKFKNNQNRWTTELKTAHGRPIGRMLADGGALIEANFLPGGFIRLRRAVLERFKAHYTDLTYTDHSADPLAPDRVYTAYFENFRENGVCTREDVTFSHRLRAMGEQIWIEPRVSISHYGTAAWPGNLDGWLRSLPRAGEEAA